MSLKYEYEEEEYEEEEEEEEYEEEEEEEEDEEEEEEEYEKEEEYEEEEYEEEDKEEIIKCRKCEIFDKNKMNEMTNITNEILYFIPKIYLKKNNLHMATRGGTIYFSFGIFNYFYKEFNDFHYHKHGDNINLSELNLILKGTFVRSIYVSYKNNLNNRTRLELEGDISKFLTYVSLDEQFLRFGSNYMRLKIIEEKLSNMKLENIKINDLEDFNINNLENLDFILSLINNILAAIVNLKIYIYEENKQSNINYKIFINCLIECMENFYKIYKEKYLNKYLKISKIHNKHIYEVRDIIQKIKNRNVKYEDTDIIMVLEKTLDYNKILFMLGNIKVLKDYKKNLNSEKRKLISDADILIVLDEEDNDYNKAENRLNIYLYMCALNDINKNEAMILSKNLLKNTEAYERYVNYIKLKKKLKNFYDGDTIVKVFKEKKYNEKETYDYLSKKDKTVYLNNYKEKINDVKILTNYNDENRIFKLLEAYGGNVNDVVDFIFTNG